ncbi:DUF4234 domain-containing protein [Mobiluncus curtisii]|uniref:DUF4234 domain-containing protein n=1 Tax=Mobiluncus curtisii TaxID=2051 RepID=UPI0014707C9A|nr:DUF4234 domain-containing protein [Mobiluncus curtisii]MCV0020115.1 DUF4234 domain-containing protein [Mobiluncus curtisii]NMW47618.1 DUF4234 domain-containing protein [Mobiluncus curtisii]
MTSPFLPNTDGSIAKPDYTPHVSVSTPGLSPFGQTFPGASEPSASSEAKVAAPTPGTDALGQDATQTPAANATAPATVTVTNQPASVTPSNAPQNFSPSPLKDPTALLQQGRMGRFKTNRSFWAYFFLSPLTFGIYGLIFMYAMTEDLNTVAWRDGKKTMNYLLLIFIVGPLTLGIGSIVWIIKVFLRIENQIKVRQINYNFSLLNELLWMIPGTLILIGPFVGAIKWVKAMNLLNADANLEMQQMQVTQPVQTVVNVYR